MGYIVPESGFVPTNGDLRAFLYDRLPDYMIPAFFVVLDKLPLTPNSKVDRNALPKPNINVNEFAGLYCATHADGKESRDDLGAGIED